MNTKHIDIHAHLNFPDFDKDRDEVLARANKKDVSVINIGTNYNSSTEVVRLANSNENMYAIIGLHPIYVPKEPAGFDVDDFENLIANGDKGKIVGVGECGLDYFHLEGDIKKEKSDQEKAFRSQIEFAIVHDLPIMIHCRDAYDDVLKILKEYKSGQNSNVGESGKKLRGNVHFFAGTKDQAQDFLELDFTISFTGVITFAKQYEELVEVVPLDKMHAETDCPYVAPSAYRGKRNEPSYVIEMIEKIAEIKGLEVDEVAVQLKKNAEDLFGV
jgi:TatD DNase family protein